MAFQSGTFTKARELLHTRRSNAVAEAEERLHSFCEQYPEYMNLRRELATTGRSLASVIFGSSDDVSAQIMQLKERNLSLQAKMKKMLCDAGLPVDYLEPHFECPLCNDTGYIDGVVCECLRKAMRSIAYTQLNSETPLSISTFDSFRLDVYPETAQGARGLSPRAMMQKTLDKCRRYAHEFSLESPSLLLQGGVGLGKTHLSLAIAGEVINKGYGVIYGSTQSFMYRIEREHFGKAEQGEDTLSLLRSADLLILDDLGTEYTSPFIVSVMYELINSRLLASKPTIISTNLTVDGLTEKYTERMVSRILGAYNRYQFCGKDLRVTLRKAARQKPVDSD